MRETFKNVSIFIVFVIALIVWLNARPYLNDHFDFKHGKTVFMCLWSVCVIIWFHLLYHFLGKATEKMIYLSTVISLVAIGGLVYFDHIRLG